MGWPKKLGTSSSIRECVWIKLRVRSGRDRESLTHWPGLGSGTLVLCTGSQFELIALCSLKLPLNVSVMSCKEKAHTAEPLMLFTGVVNVPYINCADLLPYWPDINSVVDSENNARRDSRPSLFARPRPHPEDVYERAGECFGKFIPPNHLKSMTPRLAVSNKCVIRKIKSRNCARKPNMFLWKGRMINSKVIRGNARAIH